MLSMIEDLPGRRRPAWVLLENVSFMLRLDQGAAMEYLVQRLEGLGYSWAYRVLDSRSFGLPQRRQRVILLAGRQADPAGVLFPPRDAYPPEESEEGKAIGFYWTEGTRGIGWAPNCIPTLKGGSGLGIPSPPAIWLPDGSFVTPNLQSAERLQGFPPGHTAPARDVDARSGDRCRWRLLGNAVSVGVATWVGERLGCPSIFDRPTRKMPQRWPLAAFGGPKLDRRAVDASPFPARRPQRDLFEFVRYRSKVQVDPLSPRALRGFYERYIDDRSNLRYRPAFCEAMRRWLSRPEHRERNRGWMIPTASRLRKSRGAATSGFAKR